MNKYHLLISLIFALALTACTADAGQEPAMSTGEEVAAKSASPLATTPMSDDVAVPTEQMSPTAVSQAAATQPAEESVTADLPVIGPAPSWDNDVWINSEKPLPLEDLRGKVVLLEFWTFG